MATFKQFTADERNLFDHLYKFAGTGGDVDAKKAELKRIIEGAKAFNYAPSREGYLRQALKQSKYFANSGAIDDMTKDLSTGLDKGYWKLLDDKDIKMFDVNSLVKQGVNTELFDKNSPRHFSKLSPAELDDYASLLGFGNVRLEKDPKTGKMVMNDESRRELMEALQAEQTRKDNYAKAHGEDMGGWTESPAAFINNFSGAARTIFTPRYQEAMEEGREPTWKDLGLDVGENALYLINPFGRGAGAVSRGVAGAEKLSKGAKAANKLLGAGKEVIDIAADPVVMELADAAAYSEDENKNRADISGYDMGVGTLTNMTMNKVVPGLVKKGKEVVTKWTTPVETPTELAKWSQQQLSELNPQNFTKEQLDAYKKFTDEEFWKNKTPLEREKYRQTLEDVHNLEQQNVAELQKNASQKRNKTAKELLGEEFSGDNLFQPSEFASNKAGDLLSENPKFVSRSMRSLPMGRYWADFSPKTEEELRNEELKQQYRTALELLGR